MYKKGDMRLPGAIMVGSKALSACVKWSAIGSMSDRSIVSGDLKGHVMLVALSTKGRAKPSLFI